MIRNLKSISITFGIALLAVIFISAEIEARGGRGGGRGGGGRSFSRGGSASRGSFSSRSSLQSGTRGMSQGSSRVSQGQRSKMADTSRGTRDNKMADTRPGTRDTKRADTRPGTGENKRASQGDRQEKSREDMQDDRQEWKDQNREDIQKEVGDRQEDRQDFYEDAYDDYWDDRASFYYGAAVGASAVRTTTYIVTLPCTSAPVVVNGTSYYNCSSTWYQKSFSGSQVTYITVAAPPGH